MTLGRACRIGIDGRALRGFVEGRRTGVARYTWELCKELDKLLPMAQFFVYSPVPIELPVHSDRWQIRIETSALFRRLKPVLWSRYRCGRIASRDNLEAFWAAGSFLPKLPNSVRTILTVYDLTYKYAPESMELSHKAAFKLFFKKDLLRADRVTTISQGTADRVFETFERKIDAIIYPSVQAIPMNRSPDMIQDSLSLFGIKTPFILAVGTLELRKNVALLIRSMRQLKQCGKLSDYSLVLVGGKGWHTKIILENVKKDPWIKLLGYVEDERLADLYQACSVFAFPSIYEGFGMPVLEARSFGARVVTIDLPELREAGGEESIYAEPTLDSFAQALLTAAEADSVPGGACVIDWPTWKDGAAALSGQLQK